LRGRLSLFVRVFALASALVCGCRRGGEAPPATAAAPSSLPSILLVTLDTTRADTCFLQKLEPLATARTEIDHQPVSNGFDVRQVNSQPSLDLFTTAAKAIFERRVKRVEVKLGAALELFD